MTLTEEYKRNNQMTLTEEYKVWLENNVVPFGPAHDKKKMTDKMNSMEIDNPNKEADDHKDSVERVAAHYVKGDSDMKNHIIDHIKKNSEWEWQAHEHLPDNHPLRRHLDRSHNE